MGTKADLKNKPLNMEISTEDARTKIEREGNGQY